MASSRAPKLLNPVRPLWHRPRRLALVLSTLVVVSGVAGAWLLLRGDGPAATSSMTATVSTQTLKQTVTASGTVAAATTEDLSFDVSGTVTKVFVEPGDTVKRGQRLARVDDDVLQAELDAAESSLDAAETAQAEHISDGASDEQLAADEASVLAAESSLTQAQDAVEDAVLRSTIAGTVTHVGLEVGDSAGSGSSSSQPSTGTGSSSSSTSTDTASGTITVVSTGRFVVDATVSSSDVEKVEKGMQAEITVSGIDETVYGTVSEVGLVAETDSSGAAAFPVTVEVTGERDDLYSGTAADVAVVVSQRTDVLTVDSRAVQADGDTTYVERVTDSATGATEQVAVETGETSGMVTEVTSGLAEGDVVQVPGFAGPGGNGGDQDLQELQRQMQERMQNGGGFPGGGQGGGIPGGAQ